MKRVSMLMAVVLCMVASLSFAQTAQTSATKSSQGVTDEDLKKYAMTMDSVKVMQTTLQQIIAENVQKNTVMEVARYNQLFKIANDEQKLAAANVTAEERAFLKEINDLKDLNMKRINAAYQALVKEYVGLKTFNTIKKSLETDTKLKERYDAIAQEVKSGDTESVSNRSGK